MDRGDGVVAEVGFEEEEEAGEAGGRVGRGVGMGIFGAQGELDVVGLVGVGAGV